METTITLEQIRSLSNHLIYRFEADYAAMPHMRSFLSIDISSKLEVLKLLVEITSKDTRTMLHLCNYQKHLSEYSGDACLHPVQSPDALGQGGSNV